MVYGYVQLHQAADEQLVRLTTPDTLPHTHYCISAGWSGMTQDM